MLGYRCPLCDLWVIADEYNEHFKAVHPERRKKPKERREVTKDQEKAVKSPSPSVRAMQGGLPSLGKRR